jgi:hypothetical protein
MFLEWRVENVHPGASTVKVREDARRLGIDDVIYNCALLPR